MCVCVRRRSTLRRSAVPPTPTTPHPWGAFIVVALVVVVVVVVVVVEGVVDVDVKSSSLFGPLFLRNAPRFRLTR